MGPQPMRHSMRHVVELELWSRPGSWLPSEIGKLTIAPQCMRDLELREGIVPGLSAIPDPPRTARMSIEDQLSAHFKGHA